jgi:hypothetical protein
LRDPKARDAIQLDVLQLNVWPTRPGLRDGDYPASFTGP